MNNDLTRKDAFVLIYIFLVSLLMVISYYAGSVSKKSELIQTLAIYDYLEVKRDERISDKDIKTSSEKIGYLKCLRDLLDYPESDLK